MNKKALLSGLIIILIGFVGFISMEFSPATVKSKSAIKLKENNSNYPVEKDVQLREIYITVFPAKDSSKYPYTFQQLNADKNYRDEVKVEVEVLLQEGQAGSPKQGLFGFGLTDANGVMSLKGRSTRVAPQKSYRVELNKKGGLWRGNKVIILNKHPYDWLRCRNKLSFDYLQQVSDMVSLRTEFVHLYIRDLSDGNYQSDFQDYGLFTQVENVDEDFLKNHGLDRDGQLYKANNFEFFRYPDSLKLTNDSGYSRTQFESILEIVGKEDHKKLIKMLEDVNDRLQPINKVIDKHFDRENYLTWLAVNILFGNADTISQNFYLYSPEKKNTWYFLPWDYDGAWGFYDLSPERKNPWQQGVSTYWGVVLHQRFLSEKSNVEALSKKIEVLAKEFSANKTKELLSKYQPIVTKFAFASPDKEHYYNFTPEQLKQEFARLPGIIKINQQKYYESLQKPMPVHMGKPINFGSYCIFKWSESYDFQGDWLQYKIDISKTPSFQQIIYSKQKINDTEHIVNKLPKGKYYWRLTIFDAKGNKQIPFDIYKDDGNKPYFGVQEFYIQ